MSRSGARQPSGLFLVFLRSWIFVCGLPSQRLLDFRTKQNKSRHRRGTISLRCQKQCQLMVSIKQRDTKYFQTAGEVMNPFILMIIMDNIYVSGITAIQYPNHSIYVQGASTLKANSYHIHILTSSQTRNNTELLIKLYILLHHNLPTIKLHLLPNLLDDPNIRTDDLNHDPANRIPNIWEPATSQVFSSACKSRDHSYADRCDDVGKEVPVLSSCVGGVFCTTVN